MDPGAKAIMTPTMLHEECNSTLGTLSEHGKAAHGAVSEESGGMVTQDLALLLTALSGHEAGNCTLSQRLGGREGGVTAWEAFGHRQVAHEGIMQPTHQNFQDLDDVTFNPSDRTSQHQRSSPLQRTSEPDLHSYPTPLGQFDLLVKLVERCFADHIDISQAAIDRLGQILRRSLKSHINTGSGPRGNPVVDRRDAGSLVRLLVGFSRLRRRPPHSTMNLMLAAIQPHLPDMPVRFLSACLGALSRLRFVPTTQAQGWLAACLEACAARVEDFNVMQALTVIRALVAVETSPWAR